MVDSELVNANIVCDSTPHASPGNGEADQAGSCFSPLKVPLTNDELLAHLREKGLRLPAAQAELAENALSQYGYYRMRGYWLTLESNGRFSQGVHIGNITNIMSLDAVLSSLISEMIRPIELFLRSQLSSQLGTTHGARALHESLAFNNQKDFAKLQSTLEREKRQSQRAGNPLVLHNLAKYGCLPIWAEVEISSFGALSKIYENLKSRDDRRAIAGAFGVPERYLRGWLRYLTQLRNMAAHHDRLYNRILKVRPKLFSEHKGVDNARLFPAFLVLLRLNDGLDPAAAAKMRMRLGQAIDEHHGVNLRPIGFPENWRSLVGLPTPAPRPRGKSSGRPKRNEAEVAEALRLYNSRELPIAEIVARCHISTSTLYKYIHLQEKDTHGE